VCSSLRTLPTDIPRKDVPARSLAARLVQRLDPTRGVKREADPRVVPSPAAVPSPVVEVAVGAGAASVNPNPGTRNATAPKVRNAVDLRNAVVQSPRARANPAVRNAPEAALEVQEVQEVQGVQESTAVPATNLLVQQDVVPLRDTISRERTVKVSNEGVRVVPPRIEAVVVAAAAVDK